MKIRIYSLLVVNTIIAVLGIYLWMTYLPEIPDTIALGRDADGSITARVPSKSIWILPLLFAGIHLIGIFAASSNLKIKFKNKDGFEKSVPEEKRTPVYSLIKESVYMFVLVMGFVILYIQSSLVLLGLEKVKKFHFYPILILFAIFVLVTTFYKKAIDKKAESIIKLYSNGAADGKQ